jgi:sporulation protein YlmC with PRC-barrel domain
MESGMQFKKDAKAHSADGKEVGHLDRVVIDPRSRQITHLVVQSGGILSEDRLIPIDVVRSDGDQIYIDLPVERIEELPRFQIKEYLPVDASELGDLSARVPPEAALYWYPTDLDTPPPFPPTLPVEIVVENVPPDKVALREGARVLTAGGKHAGHVERIIAHPSTHEVSHFVISKGLLLKSRKLVPAAWVARVDEDEVHLAVGASMLARLRDDETV